MKQWQETALILDRVIQLSRAGRRAALATVTRIVGSAYRRAGAKLLIEDDGSVLGGVSGGCLEEDVRQVGLRVLRSGECRTLHYETGDDETRVWGLGLGCDGKVDLFVQPISPESALGPWARVRELLAEDSRFAVATVVADGPPRDIFVMRESGPSPESAEDPALQAAASAALRARQSRLQDLGPTRLFVEVLLPPPKLLVCGAAEDARPLVALAASVGFRVSVADHRPAHLTPQRLPEAQTLLLLRPDEASAELRVDNDTYAVVKTHSLKHDTAWVKRLIGSELGYLGILGPRARTQKILAELGIGRDPRVFGPVGLDLGADGPEQVALSVVAELLAVRRGRQPRHLRELEVAVHAHA